LAKLRREAEEIAKTNKRLLAVHHEAELQKKAEIAKLQEELRALKAKQSLSFNQPSPEYTVPNQSNFTERTEFFIQPPPHTTFSRNPFFTLSSLVLRIKMSIPFARGLGILSLPCLKKFRSPHGHKHTG
jgi:arginine deiminase